MLYSISMHQHLSYEDYLASLPKKTSGAAVFLFDEADRLLLLKPSYREYWLLPGGVLEANESPVAGAFREVREEIGIELAALSFTGLVYNNTRDGFQFLFNGGVLRSDEKARISVDKKEILDHDFFAADEAARAVNSSLAPYFPLYIASAKCKGPTYLEVNYEKW